MHAEPPATAGRPLAGKRLLFVVNDLSFLISHRLAIAEAAHADGAEVHVAAPADAIAASSISDNGYFLHQIRMTRHGINPFVEALAFWRILRLSKNVAPDIVHLVTVKPVLYGGIAARITRVPALVAAISGLGYVFTGGDRRSRLLRGLLRPIYRTALGHPRARIVFQNDQDRSRLVSLCPGAASKAHMVRGSGVDLTHFAPSPEPGGTVTIALPSRLLREKGIGEFVDAARLLRGAGIKARCVLIGAAPQGNPSRISDAQLAAWRDEGVVELWGHRTDMPEVLASAHIIALPSYYGEGVPKVLLEAAACARPVITTDHPGCRDAVIDGETGLLVPPRDSAALAHALQHLIEAPETRRQMGIAARANAERHFDVADVVARHMTIYRDLLGEKAREFSTEAAPCAE